jgi:hypothetical protein
MSLLLHGFAAGCEATALPRRDELLVIWLGHWFGLRPFQALGRR